PRRARHGGQDPLQRQPLRPMAEPGHPLWRTAQRPDRSQQLAVRHGPAVVAGKRTWGTERAGPGRQPNSRDRGRHPDPPAGAGAVMSKAFRERNPYVIGITTVLVLAAFVGMAFAVGILHLLEKTYPV